VPANDDRAAIEIVACSAGWPRRFAAAREILEARAVAMEALDCRCPPEREAERRHRRCFEKPVRPPRQHRVRPVRKGGALRRLPFVFREKAAFTRAVAKRACA
jgi:hypothetical protein